MIQRMTHGGGWRSHDFGARQLRYDGTTRLRTQIASQQANHIRWYSARHTSKQEYTITDSHATESCIGTHYESSRMQRRAASNGEANWQGSES